jgi:hypothetical protein
MNISYEPHRPDEWVAGAIIETPDGYDLAGDSSAPIDKMEERLACAEFYDVDPDLRKSLDDAIESAKIYRRICTIFERLSKGG